MEIYMIKSRYHHFGLPFTSTSTTSTTTKRTPEFTRHTTPITTSTPTNLKSTTNSQPSATTYFHNQETTTHGTTAPSTNQTNTINSTATINNDSSFITFLANATNNYINNTLLLWNPQTITNDSSLIGSGSVNYTLYDGNDLSNIGNNVTFAISTSDETMLNSWSFCLEWSAAQHNLFQFANLFFAAAFCVPPSFKQSVLLVRALLGIGFTFCIFWGGMEICAPDILLWNLTLSLLNILHTVILTWRFLPPALTLELTELYLKVFKPLRVSKKHFKELAREAKVLTLEKGDIYAVEDVSSADERLSILLKGKLRVTCDDTHLHFIYPHQFVDSPEWESNHEQSDDVFQVTITAEEDSVYLCWPRMRLERVLRHRPTVKVVLDSIIGKDITQKLYSLNEHLRNSREIETERLNKKASYWMSRSLSVDAVNTGTRGHVRSAAWKAEQLRRPSITCSDNNSPLRQKTPQCWVPLQANHFMPTSPFTHPRAPSLLHSQQQQQQLVTQPLLPAATSSSIPSGEFTYPSTDGLLTVPPPVITTTTLEKRKLFRNSFRRNKETKTQVKFQKQVQEVCYNSLPQRPN